MSKHKTFKLTDKNGYVHYYVHEEEDTTIKRVARSIKLSTQYDEWMFVYEDRLFREKAAIRVSEIYLVEEIGGAECD